MHARQLLSVHSGIPRLTVHQSLATMHVRYHSISSKKHPADQFFEEHIEPKLKQALENANNSGNEQPPTVLTDAFSLGFFQTADQSFEDVVNREVFIVPVIDQLLRRHDLLERHPRSKFDRKYLPLMATSGYSGIGKTTMIGFIMDMFKKISIGGEHGRKVANYLSRFAPPDTVGTFMSRAAGYITIPITFNSFRRWKASEKNPEASIWSRAMSNIIFCATGKSVYN